MAHNNFLMHYWHLHFVLIIYSENGIKTHTLHEQTNLKHIFMIVINNYCLENGTLKFIKLKNEDLQHQLESNGTFLIL